MKLSKQLKQAWKANEGSNMALLNALEVQMLDAKPLGRARTVRRIWVHVHNSRINWVKSLGKGKCELLRLRPSLPHSPEDLKEALCESSKAIRKLLEEIADKDKVKIFNQSPITLLAMMVAHEAHHRGQILAILRSHKMLPDRAKLDALWDWHK